VVDAGNIDHAQVTEPMTAKTVTINYLKLGPIYSMDDLAKNRHQLYMTDVPNSVLQMAYKKIYVPLSMLTTSSLSKIHSNENLKYHKISFSNGIGKQSLEESLFLSEDMLTEMTFFQLYKNWITVLDMMPEVVVRWYEHHSRMLNDNLFSSSFVSWNDMDKQLHTQFINHPFTFEPDSSTDKHLLEFACMDLFLSQCAKYQHTFKSHCSFQSYATYQSSCTDYGSSSTTCYDPYTKPLQQGEGKKPTLCLHCRIYSHTVNTCSSTHSSQPEHPTICEWKNNKLITNKDKPVCVMYNVQ